MEEKIDDERSAVKSKDSFKISPRRTYVHQSSTRSHRQESGYIDVFLTERFRRNTRHSGIMLLSQDTKIPEQSAKTCARRFWNQRWQKRFVLLSRVAIGSKPRPEVQALLPLEEPSWPIVCGRSGSGAESAGIFLIKQRTGVSCATTQFRPSSSLRSSTSKSDENGSGKKNQKKKNRHQRKEVDATKVSRGKLHGMK